MEHLPAVAVEVAVVAVEQDVSAIQELDHFGLAADEAAALRPGVLVEVVDSPAVR